MALQSFSCLACFPPQNSGASFRSSRSCAMALSASEAKVIVSEKCSSSSSSEVEEELDLSMYPVPVTPLAGAKEIEYERALVAEAAMKSGPAITSDQVLFEDEWLLIVDKPCGVYSEHVLISVPTLKGLPYAAKYPIDNPEEFLHLANRLDRDTSGILIIARCKLAAGKMTRIYGSRELKKSYVALCATEEAPAWGSVTIESGHGKSRRGCWRVYRKQDVERSLPGGSLVKDMATKLTIINRKNSSTGAAEDHQVIAVGADDDADHQRHADERAEAPSISEDDQKEEVFIRAVPLTGRTHQIRLHCQCIGIPLIGDVKYCGPLFWKGERCRSHFLHAESVSFRHPMTQEQLEVTAPLPQWAQKALLTF